MNQPYVDTVTVVKVHVIEVHVNIVTVVEVHSEP